MTRKPGPPDLARLTRRDEIAHGLSAVTERMARACAAAGRDPAELTLVVVTKLHPVSDLRLLRELGVRDIGENRDQEASDKVDAAHAAGIAGLRVHFIGQLQTNKAGSVTRYADVVHSVDRPKLVRALDRGALAAGRRVGALVQVSLDERPDRGGAAPSAALDLAALVARSQSLDLLGVMAVAPHHGDPDPAFARLREVADEVRGQWPAATWVSAGMSADLEAAIAHGATHLRVGSAILGTRQPLR
ncbi:MAG TPA: YggS family pyridoxal phosphate-dependent enzyme [Candidatus Lustribacter sp.]|nr:YggS family pyridoxal phosphate-dependent enzyme [Candidatus Lustribacter sp.]